MYPVFEGKNNFKTCPQPNCENKNEWKLIHGLLLETKRNQNLRYKIFQKKITK